MYTIMLYSISTYSTLFSSATFASSTSDDLSCHPLCAQKKHTSHRPRIASIVSCVCRLFRAGDHKGLGHIYKRNEHIAKRALHKISAI